MIYIHKSRWTLEQGGKNPHITFDATVSPSQSTTVENSIFDPRLGIGSWEFRNTVLDLQLIESVEAKPGEMIGSGQWA